ncbi:MAG: hypothetical protein NZ952_03215 [Candidatus Bathyarchaeota archaeon]|nr:hypothetical protein [Candidatus Bathyarchaeota archaeon]
MDFSDMIANINSIINSFERQEITIKNLFIDGKISYGTFELLEKRINELQSILSDLRDALEKEDREIRLVSSECEKVLESLLVDLQLDKFLGKIEDAEYTRLSQILDEGLNIMRSSQYPFLLARSKVVKYDDIIQGSINSVESAELQKSLSDEMYREGPDSKNGVVIDKMKCEENKKSVPKSRRQFSNTSSRRMDHLQSVIHCMNPWNPYCKNTDIELSIFYDGRETPICHRCWEEISKKNIEWSNL